MAGVADRAEVGREELAQERRVDELPVVDDRTAVDERERLQPATVASVPVHDHDPREPGPQAGDHRAHELEQELGLERHRDAEPDVVWAQPGPHGGGDDDIPVRQLGRAHGDRLDEQGVGADREVLAVLLERADGQEAGRARAAPSGRLDA